MTEFAPFGIHTADIVKVEGERLDEREGKL